MTLTEWQEKLDAHNKKVGEAVKILRDAEAERSYFFTETVGYTVGERVTVPGTAFMARRFDAMEKEESNAKRS